MLKQELRKAYKAKRDALSPKDLQEYSLKISNRILQLPIWKFSFFHLFLPIAHNKEIDTEPLLTLLLGKDKNVVIPKVNGNNLDHFLLTDNTQLKLNKWGIPEPENGIAVNEKQIDVVFIPLLAFDEKGNRVGYGKGFYDRFLENCRPETIKIGLSYFKAEKEISGIEETDIPLNYCVTPEKTYYF